MVETNTQQKDASTDKVSASKDNIPKKIVLTTWTILIWIIRSPTMLMLVVGFSFGYYGGWQSGKASMLPRAIKAEKALSDLQKEMAKAIENAAVKQVEIRDDIRRQYENQRIKMDAINLRLRDLRSDVSLCAAESVMPVPPSTPGADPTQNSGQPRPAVDVLQELCADIAAKSDDTTIQLNALIEWINKTRENINQ